MSAIKIHLNPEELAAVDRAAEYMDIKPEVLAKAALDRLMLQLNDPAVRAEAVKFAAESTDSLAIWSDTAHSVHVYESQPDTQPRRSHFLRFDEWCRRP